MNQVYAENQAKLEASPGDVLLTYSGPRVVLDTEYGQLTAVFTSAGHASVGCGDDAGGRKPHVNDDNDAFTFRGERYLGHVHLYAEHGWEPHPRGHADWSAPHVVRAATWSDAPPTYAAKMVAAMTKAVAAFVAEHPGTLTDAERNHLTNDLEFAESEVRTARDALADAEHTAERYREALRALPQR